MEITKHSSLESRIDAGADGVDLGTAAGEDENEREAKQGSTIISFPVKMLNLLRRTQNLVCWRQCLLHVSLHDGQACGIFSHLFARVTNWEVLSSNDLPSGELAAANTLMLQQQFPNAAGFPKCVAVSCCVLLYASERCTAGRFVDAVFAMANLTGNQSLKGWAFELNQLELIKTVFQDDDCCFQCSSISRRSSVYRNGRGPGVHSRGMFEMEPKLLQCCTLFKNGALVTLMFTQQADHSPKL